MYLTHEAAYADKNGFFGEQTYEAAGEDVACNQGRDDGVLNVDHIVKC